MSFNFYKKTVSVAVAALIGGCSWADIQSLRYRNFQEVVTEGFPSQNDHGATSAPIREASSVVVCRSKQCAPARLSMSSEYIYNSLLQLLENNNHNKALICQANPSSKTCLENYITLPIKVGITPAYMYIDSVKISDVSFSKGGNTLKLLLNYNVTYNGQTPDCTPSQSLLYIRNVNHILLEDPGYKCKMNTIGSTSVKTVFIIDYIDLDYGFIGGYYSIGLSGPSYGGGNGYMLLRLPKDAYPLSPALTTPKQSKSAGSAQKYQDVSIQSQISEGNNGTSVDESVTVFPLPAKN